MNPRPKQRWLDEAKVSTIPVAAYRENYLNKTKKKAKLNNKSQTYNGSKYDSKFEARVAEELDWKLSLGELVEVKKQVKVSLDINGVHICNHYVDFRTVDKHGQVNYLEAKGFETRHWKLIKKLFIALLPIIDPGATYEVIKA